MTAIGDVADSGFALAQGEPFVLTCATSLSSTTYLPLAASPYESAATVAERENIAHEWAKLFTTNFGLRISMFGELEHNRVFLKACIPFYLTISAT